MSKYIVNVYHSIISPIQYGIQQLFIKSDNILQTGRGKVLIAHKSKYQHSVIAENQN